MKIFKVTMKLEFNEVEAKSKDEARKSVLEDYEECAQPHLMADNWDVEEIEEVKD